MTDRVCIGAIAGVHGVRGAVRIKSFTDQPADVGSYGPVETEDGSRKFKVKVTGEAKGLVIATLAGVSDRDAAEALKGTRLYVDRSRLPKTDEDEFFYSDLVGLEARTTDGDVLGRVRGVADFGAGDVLDIALAEGGSLMVPFSMASVPQVDVKGGWLAVVPPVYAPDEKSERAEAKQAERAPAIEVDEVKGEKGGDGE